MDESVNTIRLGDCIAGLNALPEGSVDLAFADPPFNIGYDYDVYRDALEADQYLAWSREWISAAYRALSPRGTFWLAIGDEYAAELKIESQRIGFIPRSWVVWYYTFGVNCTHKFTRSHAHLFYFVKNRRDFTFRANELENRVPSARQLVYNDSRANPDGRLPDDTWIIRPVDTSGEIVADDATWCLNELPAPTDDDNTFTLRPQDLAEQFRPSESTWYFPRVAGTFKERAGFHGCQMPEQLLGRIIRLCSKEEDLVVDPFSGSATTLAVAKKLGRRYLGFDISKEYVKLGRERLESIRLGDRLDGSPEPTMSAPQTKVGRKLGGGVKNGSPHKRIALELDSDAGARELKFDQIQLQATLRGKVEAIRRSHDGFSADRVVADPDLNEQFAAMCRRLGLIGDARVWNTLLFRLRKSGKLVDLRTVKRTGMSWNECDAFLFASEIALQKMLRDEKADSLDEILCDPVLAREFDEVARRYASGHTSLEYRWAALKLRKEASLARSRSAVLDAPSRLQAPVPIDGFNFSRVQAEPGVYIVTDFANPSNRLYVGETFNLRDRLRNHFARRQRAVWSEFAERVAVQAIPRDIHAGGMLGWQRCFAIKFKPILNLQNLCHS